MASDFFVLVRERPKASPGGKLAKISTFVMIFD